MAADLPLKLLLITFASFVNRSRSIADLLEENRVFREHLRKMRVVPENSIELQQQALHRPLKC